MCNDSSKQGGKNCDKEICTMKCFVEYKKGVNFK